MIDGIGEPEVRAGERKTCIYDATALPSQSNEHFFNDCWGGSRGSHKFICDDCNGAFAGSVDAAFVPYTDWIFNAYDEKPSRRPETPKIAFEGEHELGPRGKPRLKAPTVTSTKAGQTLHVQITANSKGEVRRLLEGGDLEAQLGFKLSEEKRKEVLAALRAAEKTAGGIGWQEKPIELDLQGQYRSAAHTALLALKFYAPELLDDPATSALRDFARHGTGSWINFAALQPAPSMLESMTREQLTLYNQVEVVWDRDQGKVYATLTVLGVIRRTVVLVDSYAGPTKILGVIEGVGPDRMFKAYECTNPLAAQVMKPRAALASAPNKKWFQAELHWLLAEVNTAAPIRAAAWQGFAKLQRKHKAVTPAAIEQLKKVLADTVLEATSRSGSEAVATDVEAALAAALEQIRTEYDGADLNTPAVASAIANTLETVLHQFCPKPDAQVTGVKTEIRRCARCGSSSNAVLTKREDGVEELRCDDCQAPVPEPEA